MNRLLVLFLFAALPYTSEAQYSWEAQNSTTTDHIQAVDFLIDNIHGIAGCWNGAVLRTNNQGTDWTYISDIPEYGNTLDDNIKGIHFKDDSTVFIACYTGYMYTSSDGGVNWSIAYHGASNKLVHDIAISGNRIIVGRVNDILITDNFGLTWDSISVAGLTSGVLGIDFTSSGAGFACGANGELSFSPDAGNSWFAISGFPISINLNDIYTLSTGAFVVVGDGGLMYSTIDGGTSWVDLFQGTGNNLYAVDFANSTHGIVVGANNTVYFTTDGGINWTSADPVGPSASQLWNCVAALNTTRAYIGGDNGELYASPANLYDIDILNYLGPDTTCFNRPFTFSFDFTNLGPGIAVNPVFQVIVGGTDLFGATSYNGTVGVGQTVTFTRPVTYTTGPGDKEITIFAKIGLTNIVGYFLAEDTIHFANEVPYSVTGSLNFCAGDTIPIEATGGITYYWESNFVDPYLPNQDVMPTSDTIFVVEIEQDYCLFKDTVSLFLDPGCFIDTTDTNSFVTLDNFAFSPNNDGVNDKLILDFIDPSEELRTVSIYNRWGDLVYRTYRYDNVDFLWDGTYGKRLAPAGTYFMVAQTSNYGVVTAWIQVVR